jgi:anti-sigma factor RsiW
MNCEEAQEWITALVDNELSGVERLTVEEHLKSCLQCQQAFAREFRIKEEIYRASALITAPPELRQTLEASGSNTDLWRRAGSWLKQFLTTPLVRPALALAALLLVIYPLIFRGSHGQSIALTALTTHAEIEAGRRPLTRIADANALKIQLVQAVGGRFAPMGFDLSLMKLHPVSGFMERINGREVLVTVYQGEGSSVTCFTFLGSESDAPVDAEKIYDAAKRINFYSFAKSDVQAVLHREGEVICILVAKMPPADLLALARGKARHA